MIDCLAHARSRNASMSHALTCRPQNAGEQIERLFKAGSEPLIIIGFPMKIEHSPRASVLDPVRKPDRRMTREPQTARYQIVGSVLGTDRVESIEVLFTRHCSGPWCGVMPRAFEAKAFLLYEEDDKLQGHAGPCSSSDFPLPTADQTAALEQCLSEKKCNPDRDPLKSRARPHR